MDAPLTIDDIRAAAGRLQGVAHRTPVLTSATLDRRVGATVLMKAECFQRSGSFKFRGAYNTLASLSPAERRAGVVAFSSGNHAGAVALAAALLDVQATIVMPEDAPAAKMAATRGYGAEVVTYDRYTEDREAIGAALVEERGSTLVPPFDDLRVIAGQGTAGLELAEDAGPLDVLVAPLSGGGLLAGCAIAARAVSPGVRVVGVEPEAGDDWKRSLTAGERVTIDVPRTIADGLQVSAPGRVTYPINRDLLDEVALVSDDDLLDAMAFAFERLKIVLEPSGAAGLAALLAGRVPGAVPGSRVGVILSGGNVGLGRFVELFSGRR